MNKPILEEARKGFHLAVYADPDPASPAMWGHENICGWNRHFSVENPHVNRDIFGALIRAEGFEEHIGEADKLRAEYHVFPLDAYVHGGVVLSLHGEGYPDRWDTSAQAGCVIVSRREEKSRQRAQKIARGIVVEWNQYLAGEVFGFVIAKETKCDKCGQVHREEKEAVWGIYGDAGNAMAAAREAAALLE